MEYQIEYAKCDNEKARRPGIVEKNYITGEVKINESYKPFCYNARIKLLSDFFLSNRQCGPEGRYFEKRDEEQNKEEIKANENVKISFWQKIKNLFKSVFSSGI